MPTFIEKCNCKGSGPERLRYSRHYLRPRIVGELLKDRVVPRYLVGPKGYGKSSVAFEYAQLMFEFEHVFWVNCESPCFLRDLDRGDLASAILSEDGDAALVVCDDVPSLDPDRVALFYDFANGLAKEGCELLVTCIPSMEESLGAFRSAVVVDSRDLLLGDDEIQMDISRGNVALDGAALLRDCDRAPAMLWADDGAAEILDGIKGEDLPLSMRLLMLAILILGSGRVSVLEGIADARTISDDLGFLERRYPYLGIDLQDGSFDAISVACDVLRARSRMSLADVAPVSSARCLSELAFLIADELLEAGSAQRAASFLAEFTFKGYVAKWAVLRGWRLVMEGEMLCMLRLAGGARREQPELRMHLDALCAWAAYGIGEQSLMLRSRNRALGNDSSEWACRCAVAALGCADFSQATAREAVDMLEAAMPMVVCDGVSSREAMASSPLDWNVFFCGCRDLLQAIAAIDGDAAVSGDASGAVLCMPAPPGRELARALSERISREADAAGSASLASSCLVAAWSVRAILVNRASEFRLSANAGISGAGAGAGEGECTGAGEGALAGAGECAGNAEAVAAATHAAASIHAGDGGLPESWAALTSCLLEVVERFASDSSQDLWRLPKWVWHECASALSELAEALPYQVDYRLPKSCTALLNALSAELSNQATAYRRDIADRERREAERLMTLPDSPRYDIASRSGSDALRGSVPPMRVRMFGGLDVCIGEHGYDTRTLARCKSKVALAILTLSKGREVSRERMSKALWPDSEFESRQRNFYVIWSDLRRVLSVEGRCPYLVRTQTGYRLDVRYVSSDLDDFDQLCHELLFGTDDMAAWREMFDKASGDYSEELLPGMFGNDMIDSMRIRCKSRLVDGLVAASVRMGAHGEHRGAIWFAREALSRDSSREDAYISLMESQLRSDQRGAALETYFDCRRHLSDQLGIDPSPRIMEVYRSIIESEEEF